MDSLTQLDRHLSERIRREIEERYLTPINARASLDQAVRDPLFYQNPEDYPPRLADQSVVRHRDVADQILHVLNAAHGLLIDAMDLNGLAFVGGMGPSWHTLRGIRGKRALARRRCRAHLDPTRF